MPDFLENVDISGDFLTEALSSLTAETAAKGVKFDVPEEEEGKEGASKKPPEEAPLTEAQKRTLAAQKLEDKQDVDDFMNRSLGKGALVEDDEEEEEKKPPVKKAPAAVAKAEGEAPAGPWADLHKEFIEKGLILDDEEIPFDGSYDSLMDAIELSNQVRREEDVSNYLQSVFKGNPANADTGVRLFNHLAKGGKVADFVDAYSSDTIKETALESDKEEVVRSTSTDILRKYYSLLKWDASSIDKAVETALNTGTYKQQAQNVLPEYNKLVEGRKVAVTENARIVTERALHERKQLNTALVDVINKSDEIAGYPIGKKKEKKEALIDYYFTPSEEVQGGKVSKFVADMREASKDPNWTVLLGLVYNAYKKGTGPQAAVTKAGSEVIKGVRKTLEDYAAHRIGGNGEVLLDPSKQDTTKKKGGLLKLFEDEN